MSLPKIKDFTDFNHYPSDPQPTTDADMQDYMQNQNDILGALTKRLWQPQTEYKLGDIVASDTMADGLVAVCTIAGVTSDIEPTWGVNEATVIDNSCTWIMRPAYCYGLATDGDVQTVYDGGEAEVSRLLSLGVVGKIFNLLKSFTNEKIKDLFGESNILPIVNGGTGATTASDACANIGALPTSGGIVTGTIAFNKNNLSNSQIFDNSADANQFEGLYVSAIDKDNVLGARLVLRHALSPQESGSFTLQANNKDGNKGSLVGTPTGVLTWNTKSIEVVEAIGTNYIKFKSGLQICWGWNSYNGHASQTITLPRAFKNTSYAVVASDGAVANSSACYSYGVYRDSKTAFTLFASTSAQHNGFWIAMGLGA